PGKEENRGSEVREAGGRGRVGPLPVDGQDPLREKAGVEGEQARRVGRRSDDVAPPVADDEGVAVEDLYEIVRHVASPYFLCDSMSSRPARSDGSLNSR